MPDLRKQLQSALRGRVCFMGLGNTAGGDDGLGLRLAETLRRAGVPDVVIAGTIPEHLVGRYADSGFDHLVFLDAVDFRAPPGSAVFLNSEEIAARYPQVSTHKIALGILAKYIEHSEVTQVWLLGVQPGSLKAGVDLSPAVETTVAVLADLIRGIIKKRNRK
jgi:hydrogenase maturation protease